MAGHRILCGIALLVGAASSFGSAQANGPRPIPRMAPPPMATHHHGARPGGGPHGHGAHGRGWHGGGWHGGGWHGGGTPGWSVRHSGGWPRGWCATSARRTCTPAAWSCGLAPYGGAGFPWLCGTGGWLDPLGCSVWPSYYPFTILNVQPLVVPPFVQRFPVPSVDPLDEALAGVEAVVVNEPNADIRLAKLGAIDRSTRATAPREKVRSSSLEARRRAARATEQGDDLFAHGRYLEALQKYKSAAAYAEDLAEPLVRQGFAYLAARKYAAAAAAMRRGLAAEPDYAEQRFRLHNLYRTDHAAKTTHLEQLAETALNGAEDPELYFLIGVFLHYDGESDRAEKFFAQAVRRASANQRAAIELFLPAEPLRLPVVRTAVR